MLSYFMQWYRYLTMPGPCQVPGCDKPKTYGFFQETCSRVCQLTLYEITRRVEKEECDRNYELAEKAADKYMDQRTKSKGAR